MYSGIYVGNVRHHRFKPAVNRFTYSIYLLMLDLDELESVFDRNWLWSCRRFNFAWFRKSDHLRSLRDPRDDSDQSLKQIIKQFLSDNGIDSTGPVRLLTQVRHLGFAMNPASFFYCYDIDGDLQAIVTQVNNTPWGEEHLYLIDARNQDKKNMGTKELPKEFHVSPFMPMDMHYDMRFTRPGEKLAIRMTNFRAGSKILDVVMSLTRQNLTSLNLNRLLISYPLMSLKVFAAIYWQALKLYLKKMPFYSHPRTQQPKSTNAQASQPVSPKQTA